MCERIIRRMPQPEIVLYERDGCHLCEDARVLLDDMLGPDRYSRVDIDTDDDLLLRYAHHIPVVTVDGVQRLELVITAPDVRSLAVEL